MVIKSRRIKLTGHLEEMGGIIIASKILAENFKRKRLLR
jgi:hypothetical protein